MMKKTTPSHPEPTFEEALKRLETLVEAMESGEITLTDMVTRYEEGSRVLKICERELAAAELKIEKLKDSAHAEPATEPFDPEPSP